MNRDSSFHRRRGNTDWTSVIVQSLLRRIERNTCIHRHIPRYDFSNSGMFQKSHRYKSKMHRPSYGTEI